MSESQCGDNVTINGQDAFATYHADLIEANLEAGEVSATYSKNTGKNDFVLHNSVFGPCKLKLRFYVSGNTAKNSVLNASNLIAACKSCVIRIIDSTVEYAGILTSYQIVDTTVEYYQEVELELNVIRRLLKVTYTFPAGGSGTASFANSGNTPSGVAITITASAALTNVTVCGITITELSANVPFIIDGINGTVTSNGLNAFAKTNLIDFPKVVPGTNSFTLDTRVTVKFEFYPTFVV